MRDASRELGERAAAWAEQSGYPVFPCLSNKRPALRNHLVKASSDPATIIRLFRLYHDATLIGLPTGARSFDAVDFDFRKGQHVVEWRDTRFEHLVNTFNYGTQSGGRHYAFQHEPGMRNSAGRPIDGVDVRSEGGHVIAWWLHGLDCDARTVLPWPRALLAELKPPPVERTYIKRETLPDRYVEQALKSGWNIVRSAGDGSRNFQLNEQTYSLARYIPEGFSEDTLRNCMTDAALTAGLKMPEIERTIDSALRARGRK